MSANHFISAGFLDDTGFGDIIERVEGMRQLIGDVLSDDVMRQL